MDLSSASQDSVKKPDSPFGISIKIKQYHGTSRSSHQQVRVVVTAEWLG